MAQVPLTILEQKWANSTTSNTLIQAASTNADRKNPPRSDRDAHRNVSSLGRRTLMDWGRHLFENVPYVRGAVLEQATLAVSTFMAQYYGANEAFKDLVESWLFEHDKICDVRGWPFNMRTLLRNIVISILRDGDIGILLTETPDGYPLFQAIPAHRIGCRTDERIVQDGVFKGFRIIDGVIVTDYGRTIGYRLLTGERDYDYSSYRDVPASDLILIFLPEYVDQVRGLSPIGKGAFDQQDIKEFEDAQLIQQKNAASIALQEWNEDGEPPPGADLSFVGLPDSTDTISGTPTGLVTETVDKGTVRYFRSKSGNKLEVLEHNNPGQNTQNFTQGKVRASLHGFQWSYDFSLNPKEVGGAPFRVIVEKINITLRSLRSDVIIPFRMRADGWRISKAIKLGLLPDDKDWWKIEYQGPADITADKKYDSSVDIEETRNCLRAPQDAIARRGEYWEDIQDKAIDFQIRGVKRTKEKAAAAGLEAEDVEWADVKWNSPNGPQQEQQQAEEPKEPKDE